MTYRILSLDGGGAWALIETRALISLYSENTTGHQVLSDFNLVAANSGGSLVLGGLVEDLSLGELLGYFEDQTKRKSIFSPSSSLGDKVLHDLTGLGPKYSAVNKLPALQRLLPQRGNRPLSQAVANIRRPGFNEDVRLLIVGFDYDRSRATFFRSAAASGPQWGQGAISAITLAEAIHASTNAPVNYFDAPALADVPGMFPDEHCRYWDGGVTGCNNPVLAAVTEAIVAGQRPGDIVALSLGTANVHLPWPTQADPRNSPYIQAIAAPGLVADLRKLATSILDDPPDAATFLAHVMTGGTTPGLPPGVQSRIVRMNPLISPIGHPGAWTAPGADPAAGAAGAAAVPLTSAQFTYLVNLDMDAVEQPQVQAISHLADLWIAGHVVNQPIRMDGDTLMPELGASTFPGAAEAWRLLRAL